MGDLELQHPRTEVLVLGLGEEERHIDLGLVEVHHTVEVGEHRIAAVVDVLVVHHPCSHRVVAGHLHMSSGFVDHTVLVEAAAVAVPIVQLVDLDCIDVVVERHTAAAVGNLEVEVDRQSCFPVVEVHYTLLVVA